MDSHLETTSQTTSLPRMLGVELRRRYKSVKLMPTPTEGVKHVHADGKIIGKLAQTMDGSFVWTPYFLPIKKD